MKNIGCGMDRGFLKNGWLCESLPLFKKFLSNKMIEGTQFVELHYKINFDIYDREFLWKNVEEL